MSLADDPNSSNWGDWIQSAVQTVACQIHGLLRYPGRNEGVPENRQDVCGTLVECAASLDRSFALADNRLYVASDGNVTLVRRHNHGDKLKVRLTPSNIRRGTWTLSGFVTSASRCDVE